MNEIETIKRQMEEWNLHLDDSTLETLVRYVQQLSDYQEANVVGTRSRPRLLLEHVLDSLSCLLCEPVLKAKDLIDVGSGGGLPGIPLKIVRPNLCATLLEATGKKTRFLEQSVKELALDGIEIVNARAETIGHDLVHRGKYEVATARALASLSTLIEYCLPFVKKDGCLVAMKALPDEEEVRAGSRAAELLNAEVSGLIEVRFLPELPQKRRCLVVVTKTSETPTEYPRRTGIPKKSPLGAE